MAETNIQLAELNKKTVRNWHDKRSKRQEREVLSQGISLLSAPENLEPLPLAQPRPAELQTGTNDKPHLFDHPPNTASQAKKKLSPRKRKGIAPQPAVVPFSLPQAQAMPTTPANSRICVSSLRYIEPDLLC